MMVGACEREEVHPQLALAGPRYWFHQPPGPQVWLLPNMGLI